MKARVAVHRILTALLLTGLMSGAAEAQWSTGAPGTRQAPAGQNRFAFLVYANPIPGMEAEFNDWYSTVHIGDLVQLEGWVGAQRFRIVSNVTPRSAPDAYRHGYLIIWEIEGVTAAPATKAMIASIGGGKSRRGAAFDYSPGMAGAGMYQIMGPRITRPDGKGPSIPDRNDPKAVRQGRYIVMDFANSAAASDAAFNEAMDQRIKSGLTLPGWLAAQRFRVAENTGLSGPSARPLNLILWEIQALNAQAAQDAFTQALKSGTVKNTGIDEKTAQFVFWEPITPYITKDDFER